MVWVLSAIWIYACDSGGHIPICAFKHSPSEDEVKSHFDAWAKTLEGNYDGEPLAQCYQPEVKQTELLD